MAVPVKLGGSTFDFEPLRNEQTRLGKVLLNPSPRDDEDPSLTFTVMDARAPANTYSTYVKVFYNKDTDIPTYRLYMKDNLNVEHALDGSEGDPVTIDAAPDTSTVVANYLIDPVTGKITQGVNTVGYIKFEAESGLSLATINSRLSDINQALDGMTKVMTAVVGTLDNAMNLIR